MWAVFPGPWGWVLSAGRQPDRDARWPAGGVENEFSGSAAAVAQVGYVSGDLVFTLPPVAAPPRETPHQVPAGDRWFVNRAAEMTDLDAGVGAAASVGGGGLGGGAGRDAGAGGSAGGGSGGGSGRARVTLVTGLRGVGKSALVRHWVDAAEGRFPGGELYVDFAALRSRLGGTSGAGGGSAGGTGAVGGAGGAGDGRRAGGGAAVGEALSLCLRGLGVAEANLPGSLEERANLFRTRTAGSPVLVVLDDVTEPAQVTALVPRCVGSAVVATSDRRLGELVGSEGAELLVVDPLDASHGRELLAAICPAQVAAAAPDQVDALVRLCGGLPIALRVAAARLRGDRGMGIADLVAELGTDLAAFAPDGPAGGLPSEPVGGAAGGWTGEWAAGSASERAGEPASERAGEPAGGWASGRDGGGAASEPAGEPAGGLALVAAVLTSGYRALPTGAARAYLVFGLASGLELTAELAAVALDAPLPAGRAAVAELVAANLVEEQPGRRYRPHALVARHAAELARFDLPEPDASAALRRLVRHYLVWAMAADVAVMGERLRFADLDRVLAGEPRPLSGATAAQAQQWLAGERSNLRRAARLAEDLGWDEATWQLAEALAALYLNRRSPYELIEVSERGVAAAERLGRPDVQARLRCLASRGLTDLGRLDAARRHLDVALELVEGGPDLRLLASVWEFRGRLLDREDRVAAAQAYRRSLAANLAVGEPRGAALARYFLGCALDAGGQHRAALTELRDAATALTELGDARMAARARIAVGVALGSLGEDEPAAAALRQAVAVLAERGAWHYEAEALRILAEVAGRLGRPAEAVACLARAVELLDASGDPRADQARAALLALPRPE